MKQFLIIIISVALLVLPAHAAENKWTRLVEDSGNILSEIQQMPDQSVPEDLMKNCAAIAIFPNTISVGLGIGGKYGQGIIMVRGKRNNWTSPAIFTLAGASIGFQIGGQASDVVLIIMSKKSVEGRFDNSIMIKNYEAFFTYVI